MPPKSKKPKAPTSRGENAKKKVAVLFEAETCMEKASRFPFKNIVHCYNSFQYGNIKSEEFRRYGELLVKEKLRNFDLYQTEPINFDRRITALQFHPTLPYALGIGSKSGTFVVRFLATNYRKEDFVSWDGIGPGGSITCISFDPFTPNSAFTSSIDGTVQVRNYVDKTSKVLLNTGSFESWYCSVKASHDVGLVMAGDTSGNVKILNKDLKEISSHKLHKKKLNSIDFSKSRGWLFATASLDCSVKLWDIRKIDVKSPIDTMEHTDPVNSAYFSHTNGNRLLTTDQQNELRVYKGPLFGLESRIPHPHRQFQHLTPIKASWHPLCDLIVVGRYPDPKWPTYRPGELNTIDIISPESREIIVQLSSLHASGIVSLNSFNCTGEILASAMGLYVLYRKEKDPFEGGQFTDKPSDKKHKYNDDDDDPPPFKRKPPSRKTSEKKCPKTKVSKTKGK